MNSRSKGAGAEREAARLLMAMAERSGYTLDIQRNLEQTRAGGADLIGIPCMEVEVKRCERSNIPAWWRQVCKVTDANGHVPVLMYRQSRQPWMFRTEIQIRGDFLTVTMDAENFSIFLAHHLAKYVSQD